MKRMKGLFIGSVLALAAAATAVAFAGSGGPPSPPFTISAGASVPRASLSLRDQEILSQVGATGEVKRLGALRGTAFYAIDARSGGKCFAFGSESQGGLDIGCSDRPQPMTQPIIDMSIVAMNPADPNHALQFRTVQGIAADGVSSVGVVTGDGSVHATPVVGNLYRMADDAIPTGPITAIVALDAQGSTIFTQPVAGG